MKPKPRNRAEAVLASLRSRHPRYRHATLEDVTQALRDAGYNPLLFRRAKLRTLAQCEEVARRIHTMRDKGITQKVIADELGIPRNTVAYYCSRRCRANARAGITL